MREEQRLISIGWPLSEALGVCYQLRKEGTLMEFVEAEEKRYRDMIKREVAEILG